MVGMLTEADYWSPRSLHHHEQALFDFMKPVHQWLVRSSQVDSIENYEHEVNVNDIQPHSYASSYIHPV